MINIKQNMMKQSELVARMMITVVVLRSLHTVMTILTMMTIVAVTLGLHCLDHLI